MNADNLAEADKLITADTKAKADVVVKEMEDFDAESDLLLSETPPKPKPVPTNCEHPKRGLDPHLLCEACRRRHHVNLCVMDARCSECRFMDDSSFQVFLNERETNRLRNEKKKASPAKASRLPAATASGDAPSPRDTPRRKASENLSYYSATYPEDEEAADDASGSYRHVPPISPAKQK